MQRYILKSKKIITLLSGIMIALAFILNYTTHYHEMVIVLFILASIIGILPIATQAYQSLRVKVVSIDVLVSIAVIGAIFIQNYEESAVVTFLFLLGNYLEARTLNKTREAIQKLVELAPESAFKLMDNGEYVEVDVDDVEIDDILLVKTGAKIPVDGLVIEGSGNINEATITGESTLSVKKLDSSVFAGTILDNGTIKIKASRVGEDTTFAKIIELVEEAQDSKSQSV